MFLHQQHLRHLLRPEHYTTEGQYRAELRHLFLPAWHPVATVGQLRKPGDFLTLDLLETPILIRNFDGELDKTRGATELPTVGPDQAWSA